MSKIVIETRVSGWADVAPDTLDVLNEDLVKVGAGKRISMQNIQTIHRDDGYIGPADCGTLSEVTIKSEYANEILNCGTIIDGCLFGGIGNAKTLIELYLSCKFFIFFDRNYWVHNKHLKERALN